MYLVNDMHAGRLCMRYCVVVVHDVCMHVMLCIHCMHVLCCMHMYVCRCLVYVDMYWCLLLLCMCMRGCIYVVYAMY